MRYLLSRIVDPHQQKGTAADTETDCRPARLGTLLGIRPQPEPSITRTRALSVHLSLEAVTESDTAPSQVWLRRLGERRLFGLAAKERDHVVVVSYFFRTV